MRVLGIMSNHSDANLQTLQREAECNERLSTVSQLAAQNGKIIVIVIVLNFGTELISIE